MIKLKECPTCKRTYSDEYVSFCLEDGAVLSAPQISNEFNYQIPLFEEEDLTVISENNFIKKLELSIDNNELTFGDSFSVSFCRTLRIPDDGNHYPLPASLGKFPIYNIADYADKVPSEWNKHGGVFIPMYQREALFIEFYNWEDWEPNIVKIATGKINAITGKHWHQSILEGEQDYVVVPDQKWLDGFKTGSNIVRQFVAVPLGQGYTVESQISGSEDVGGIQIIVFKPKEGIFEPPPSQILKCVAIDPNQNNSSTLKSIAVKKPMLEMGIGAGGKIVQKIYKDKHGAETWDENHYGRTFVHIINSQMFKEITGLEPPETPIDTDTYQKYKIPWFEVYDEPLVDVGVNEELYEIKPIKLIDKIKGVFKKEEFLSLDIDDSQVKKINLTKKKIKDGQW